MKTAGSIVDLRNLLANRFPHLRLGIAPAKLTESVPTGVPALDMLLDGGLPRGELTELIASGSGSGSAEVIHALLRQVALNRQFLALVDGLGSFDASAVEPAVLARLLWIRCRQASEAFKAMDLLLRDRNFPVLALDLKLNTASELRKVNGSAWRRYLRLLEQNQAAVLVVTPQKLVSGAAYRVLLESALSIDALSRPRAELLSCLRFKLLKSPNQTNAGWAAAQAS